MMPSKLSTPWLSIPAAAAYLMAAAVSLAMSSGMSGGATIWPASGILLAALLTFDRRRRAETLLLCAAASLGVNLAFGSDVPTSLGFTVANIGEALIATWVMAERRRLRPSFVDPAGFSLFAGATVVAAAFSAVVASISAGFPGHGFLTSWFFTCLLGMLVVTPVVMTWLELFRTRRRAQADAASLVEVIGLLAIVGIVTAGTFVQSRYALSFLPPAVLLFVTYRLGPLGASTGTLLMALIAAGLTSFGHGRMAAGGGLGPVTVVQVYLLVVLATTMPLAALLARRDRLLRSEREANRLLGIAEEMASTGHWRLSFADNDMIFSPTVYRIHGWDPATEIDVGAVIAAYHIEDRPRVRKVLKTAASSNQPFAYEARIVRANGDQRHLRVRGMPEADRGGRIVGLVGVAQDVTDDVLRAGEIDAARAAAEKAAAQATALADTDQLTGVASRRRVMRLLDGAIAQAAESDVPLTVALLDVDHFKRVNDRYGHPVGDRVLVRVASVANGAIRPDDVIGRYGGEEFLILLAGVDLDDGLQISERIRRAIEWSRGGPGEPAVTASLGLATLTPGLDAAQLIARADAALYEAKRRGRNQLSVAA